MLLIPYEVFVRYLAHLHLHMVAKERHGDYKSGSDIFLILRQVSGSRIQIRTSPALLRKTARKKQSEQQRQQAAHAVSLYFEMMRQELPAQPQKKI